MSATAEDFRRMALALPETEERSHMGHPDFRVGGKIFATLDAPDEGWGMVRVDPELQAELVSRGNGAFAPAKGSWGAQGCTYVLLHRVNKRTLNRALRAAWEGRLPTSRRRNG